MTSRFYQNFLKFCNKIEDPRKFYFEFVKMNFRDDFDFLFPLTTFQHSAECWNVPWSIPHGFIRQQ